MVMTLLDLIPRTEKETLKFRLLAVMAVALAFLYQANDVPLGPALALVGGYLAYSYVLRSFLIPRFTSYPLLAAMLLIDVGTILIALHIIDLDSPIYGLLPIVIVYYSLYLGYVGGITTATVAVVGYTTLVIAKGQVSEMETTLAIQPFFFILALLVGYVAQQRFQETQERLSLQQLIGAEAHAKSLLDLAQALNRVLDPESIAGDIARMGALATKLPYAVVFVHDPEGNALVYQGSNLPDRLGDSNDGESLTLPVSEGSFPTSAWTTGKAVAVDRIGTDGAAMPMWLANLGGQRTVACPLRNHGEKVGVMCFVATDATATISDETVESAGEFSEVAGRMIANAQIYSQAERRSRKVAADLQQSIEMAGRFRELTQRKSLRFGPLVLEPVRESVRWHDISLRLTKTEYDLLHVLAENAGNAVSQETLIREVWGEDYIPQGKVVDVTVHRLRRKLEALPSGKKLIRTVRGQGYSFVPPDRFVA